MWGLLFKKAMNAHELKTWPQYWLAVKSGKKTFELRENDRDYQVGDLLFLACFNPATDQYERRGLIKCEVTYLLKGPAFGLRIDFCIMGIKVLEHYQPE